MICEPWDVVVVPFPFTESAGNKRRPALVLSRSSFNEGGHTVLAMITTKNQPAWPGDLGIGDLQTVGLQRPCIIRWKLFTLDNQLIVRRVGQLGNWIGAGPCALLVSFYRKPPGRREIMDHQPILGLRTALYRVTDLDKAKEWYRTVLGIDPYFDEPFYVGFNVGGFELGLDPDPSEGTPGPGGVGVYWGVEDADAALARLRELGGREHSAVTHVGGGIRVAAVLDPFGNVFGIIENPHFKLEGPALPT